MTKRTKLTKKTTPIPTQAEYEANEWRMAERYEKRVDDQSLSDRKEGQKDWLAVLRDPEYAAHLAGQLLDGNCGFGVLLRVKVLMSARRCNRVAMLAQYTAVVQKLCPRDMARAAWASLTKTEQKKVDAAIAAVIADFDKNGSRSEG